MTCASTPSSVCPCGTPDFPVVICNLPNLPAIAYRAGDYLAFRHRLLQQLPGETALTIWQPGAQGDLAVQMLEWWAYIADILTFYNERIANEAYLGTAVLPESVNHLVQILGYRPRPALGSRTTLAGLLAPKARLPVALPAGMQIQSKPGPGQQPQLFELDAPATLQAPDGVTATVVVAGSAASSSAGTTGGGSLVSAVDGSIWLTGTVTTVKPGDRLLLIKATAVAATPSIGDYAWISVTGSTPGKDPLGNPITAIAFTAAANTIAGAAQAADYVLLRAKQSQPLWSYAETTIAVIAPTAIHLAAIARDITPGTLLLVDIAGTAPPATPVLASSYTEVIWYANCKDGKDPTVPPDSTATLVVPAVPIPHALIAVQGLDSNFGTGNAANVTVRWGFAPAGTLAPVLTTGDVTFSGDNTALAPVAGAAAFPQAPAPVLLQDVNLAGATAVATPAGTPVNAITLGNLASLPDAGLVSPITVLFNLLPVSRGKTVAVEVLGSGDPVVLGQDFTLKNAPVTYFADPASVSGDNFSSTVTVSVDNIQWQEVPSFYGQSPTAQVFVLREDDAGNTHVTFGDGDNGQRPPTGTNNIVATYRYGAGALAPPSGTLTVVQTPQPGLQSVLNPLAPTGGADADAAAKLSQLAPRSVLTFNRAVSLDDYAAIALTAAGVTHAVAGYVFDALAQRPLVTIWVAGDANAATAAGAAIAGTAMPNQTFTIRAATAVAVTLSLTILSDPRYDPTIVHAGVVSALLDADAGLLGVAAIGIGQVVYNSQIEAACLAVPGVTAVHDLDFAVARSVVWRVPRRRFVPLFMLPRPTGPRHDPGAGHYFTLAGDSLAVTMAAAS